MSIVFFNNTFFKEQLRPKFTECKVIAIMKTVFTQNVIKRQQNGGKG